MMAEVVEKRLFASFERDAVFSSAAVKHWL